MLHELIGAKATVQIGAEFGEHTDTRTTWRHGHRPKTVTTQVGDLVKALGSDTGVSRTRSRVFAAISTTSFPPCASARSDTRASLRVFRRRL
jgi:hypothetical protein